jgi:hypothetical protein
LNHLVFFFLIKGRLKNGKIEEKRERENVVTKAEQEQ